MSWNSKGSFGRKVLIAMLLCGLMMPAAGAIFMQPDPVYADVYDPQQLNGYSFVRGNPYKYTDPTGKELEFAQMTVGGERTTLVFASGQYKGRIVKEYQFDDPVTGETKYDYDVQPGSFFYPEGTATIDMFDDKDIPTRKLSDIWREDQRNLLKSEHTDFAGALASDAGSVYGLGLWTKLIKAGKSAAFSILGMMSRASTAGSVLQSIRNGFDFRAFIPGRSTYLAVTEVRYAPGDRVLINTKSVSGGKGIVWYETPDGGRTWRPEGHDDIPGEED